MNSADIADTAAKKCHPRPVFLTRDYDDPWKFSERYSAGWGVFHDWTNAEAADRIWIPFVITTRPGFSCVSITIYSAKIRSFLREHNLNPEKLSLVQLIQSYDKMRDSAAAFIECKTYSRNQEQELKLFLYGFIRDSGILFRISDHQKHMISSKYFLDDIEAMKLEQDLNTIEDQFFHEERDHTGQIPDTAHTCTLDHTEFCADQLYSIGMAIWYGHRQILEMLLRRRSIQELLVQLFYLGQILDDPVLLKCMLREHESGLSQIEIDSKLFSAAAGGNIRRVDMLLMCGAAPNASRFGMDEHLWQADWENALDVALKNGHVEVARKLLQYGGTIRQHWKDDIWAEARISHCKDSLAQFFSEVPRDKRAQEERWIDLLCSLSSSAWFFCEDGWPFFCYLPYTCTREEDRIHEEKTDMILTAMLECGPLSPQLAKQLSKQLESPRCPVFHAVRAKEATKAKSSTNVRIRDIMKKQLADFIDRSNLATVSSELKSFVSGLEGETTVFKEGMTTIRKFFRNRTPTTLSQVFACIQVADAMRQATVHSEEPKDGSTSNSRPQELLKDLDRWAMLIRDEKEKNLFHELAELAWGKVSLSEGVDNHDPSTNLLYLQSLLKIVVSDAVHTNVPAADDTVAEREPSKVEIEQMSATIEYYESEMQRNEPTMGGPSDDGRDKPKLPELPTFIRNAVIVIMAGAIFGYIITFILLTRTGLPISAVTAEISKRLAVFGRADALARNCCIFLFYLGIWDVSQPSSDGSSDRNGQLNGTGSTVGDNVCRSHGSESLDLINEFGDVDYEMNSTARSDDTYLSDLAIPSNWNSIFDVTSTGSKTESACLDLSDNDQQMSSFTVTPAVFNFSPAFSGTASTATISFESDIRGTSSISHTNLTCRHCGKSFKNVGNRNRHENTACPRKPQQTRVSCPQQCGYSDTRPDNVEKHVRKGHCPLVKRRKTG